MKKETLEIIKVFLTIALGLVCPYVFMVSLLSFAFGAPLQALLVLLIPAIIPIIWLKNKKRKLYLIIFVCIALILSSTLAIQKAIEEYNRSITIDVTPSIYPHEYLPFKEDSKIVKLDNASLSLEDDLPIIDGATAALPVYSAFVHAVYPETTTLYDGVFEYNNTLGGYKLLAEKKTDIFIGAYPSKDQREYAAENGTTFEYTQIGYEAFVFFVHKDSPINSLTTEQIRAIYSGEITNWSELGGKNEKIVAFQRNEGSGSQSMMLRFMGDTPLMEPDTQEVIDGMGGIITEVADYKNKSNSIGFSFRYYVETIIGNPDIKIIAVDGVYPSVESIKNGKYPIIAPVYAVTYEGNPNKNVDKLIEWILSDEGQHIIEETGYVGIR